MMNHFCTLFNINFITQGVLMYESLAKSSKDFHLYIIAFCDKSYELLTNLNLEHATIISLSEFEDDDLLRIKPTRTLGEYCWTCSSSAIYYCINKYNLDQCTYIDADIYFYSDPKVLLDEMGDSSVLITDHRYSPMYDQTLISGIYCVQFISFKNDTNGMTALNWWRDRCIEWCYARIEDGKFGDQKYLDDWTTRFEGVHVLEHQGGGVAPWNIQNYTVQRQRDRLTVAEKSANHSADLIFYHFHSVKVGKSGRIDGYNYTKYIFNCAVRRLIYKSYIAQLIELSGRLKSVDGNIMIIKPPRYPINKTLKKFRRSFIRLRLSNGGYLKLFGIELFGKI